MIIDKKKSYSDDNLENSGDNTEKEDGQVSVEKKSDQGNYVKNEEVSENIDKIEKQSASSMSQVSGQNVQITLVKYVWHGVLGILLLVVMSGFFIKSKKTEAKPSYQDPVRASASIYPKLSDFPLRENPSRPHDFERPKPLTMSKEREARQHAPTNMFRNSMLQQTSRSSSMRSSESNGISQAVVVSAKRIAHPETMIASGELIHAVLETGISSDLPGMVRAIVSHPVYSYTGERLLVPAGARLVGQYSSSILQGQNRVMIIWNRIILPDGITVALKSPGTDTLGRAGQGADHVNNHFMARFGQATLLSLIGAGVATQGVKAQDQDNSASSYRSAIAQSFQQSANTSLESSSGIKPTLTIYQGASINVFVAQDLDFYVALGAGH